MANYQIVMNLGPTPGQTYDLSGPSITIGRDINADIVINIPEVSRRHARFRLEGGVYLLEDLGSTNGTFVNGQRLSTSIRVRDGDTIMLGEAVTLTFVGGKVDPYATIVESSSHAATVVARDPIDLPPMDPGPSYADEPLAVPPPPPLDQPIILGPSSTDPMDYGMEMERAEPKNRTWLWAAIGCLAVIIVGCLAGAVLFDMMDMYCEPPFDSLFSFLYSC